MAFEVPAELEATRGVHPRLYFTTTALDRARTTLNSTDPRFNFWARLQKRAAQFALQALPPLVEKDQQQLYLRDKADNMATMAANALVRGNASMAAVALAWARTMCGFPSWARGSLADNNLSPGHVLFATAVTYDMLHAYETPEDKATLRECLHRHAHAMWTKSRDPANFEWMNNITAHPYNVNITGFDLPHAYLWNIGYAMYSGVGAAGLALWDDENVTIAADATSWLPTVMKYFEETDAALPSDGGVHEGMAYGIYGLEFLCKWYYLSKTLLGKNLWTNSKWMRAFPMWLANVATPRASWDVKIRDATWWHLYGDPSLISSRGPTFALHAMAGEYRDGFAQWLADEFGRANGYNWICPLAGGSVLRP